MMEEGANKRRYRAKWTQEDKDAIVRYRDSGMTNRQVGEMFGVGECSISRIYNLEKKRKAARINGDN